MTISKVTPNKERKLMIDFNREAEKQNSKYFIFLDYGSLWIHEKTFLIQILYYPTPIYYCSSEDKFSLRISTKELHELKSILKAIPQKIEVELE